MWTNGGPWPTGHAWSPRFVKTEPDVGLTDAHVAALVAALGVTQGAYDRLEPAAAEVAHLVGADAQVFTAPAAALGLGADGRVATAVAAAHGAGAEAEAVAAEAEAEAAEAAVEAAAAEAADAAAWA